MKMENWKIYAIVSMIFAGFTSVIAKVVMWHWVYVP